MTFLDTLLSLDKAATPGPWHADQGYVVADSIGRPGGETILSPYRGDQPTAANAALTATLRSAAPALAAVIEAVAAYRDARFAGDSAVASGSTTDYADSIRAIPDAYHAMLDALAALDKVTE